MAYSDVSNLPGNLGLLVQVAFNKGIMTVIPDEVREWEQIMTLKVNDPLARESRYAIQTGMGPAATQARSPGDNYRNFPRPQYNTTKEIAFQLKGIQTTISLPTEIVERAMESKDKKYIDPIAYETVSKATSAKRVLTADWYGDGTGVRGEIGNTTLVANYGGTSPDDPATVTIQLATGDTARGYAGWFEYDDLIMPPVTNAGSARRALATTGTWSIVDGAPTAIPTSGTASCHLLRVKDKDHALNQVTFEVVSMDLSTGRVTGVYSTSSSNTISITSLAVTDKLYRYDQPTFPNLSGAIADYGTISEVTPGLETFGSWDGRVLDGVARSGILAGTHVDCGGAMIDMPYFQAGLSKARRRVGASSVKYTKACMAAETHNALVIEREGDRRFNQYTDNKRGTTFWGFASENDILEAYVSEYARQNRVWILPENKGVQAGKIFEYHGTEARQIGKAFGMGAWHLNPGASGGHNPNVNQYLSTSGRFVCKNSAPVVCIHNFTNNVV